MPVEKILITVKTYPTLSEKYDELVCTAGIREDGSWIRIYPIPFRKLEYEKQYRKYDWIEADLIKNTSDFRPESFRPASLDGVFQIAGKAGTEQFWAARKEFVLKNVSFDLAALIQRAKNPQHYTSLAVFKPKEIFDFIIEPAAREWDKEKLAKLKANADQFKLFETDENPFEVVRKLPYTFSYSFSDQNGKRSKLMIEDWEIGALFWNSLARYGGDESLACAAVRKKYFDDFVKTKDLHFFLGTTRAFHLMSHNPFIIIGTFHPPKSDQLMLF